MAKRQSGPGSGRRSRQAGERRGGRDRRGAGKTVLGFVLGACVTAGGVYLYQHTRTFGGQSARVPLASEKFGSRLNERGDSAGPAASTQQRPRDAAADGAADPSKRGEISGPERMPPFGASEDVFEAGARTYRAQCAGCHGRPGRDAPGSASDSRSDQHAVQFWSKRDARAGVAIAKTAGALYAETADGVQAKGMPSYRGHLEETELWDLALLLKASGDDLPDPVSRILRQTD